MTELIVTDLDRTLLNDKKEVTAYTCEVLNKCRAKGIKTAYATGRPECATKGFQRSFQPDFVICNNGADIYCKGDLIYHNPIPLDVSMRLISAFAETGDIKYLTAETGTCLYTNYTGESWDNENWNLVYNDFSKPFNLPVSKISVECKNTELLDKFISEYANLHFYLNSGEDWVQIMHVDSTKMNAVRHLSDMFDINTANTAAFGDDYNDMEMIEHCGIGIAVGNAVESVRRAAGFICLGNNDDGVAKWIEANLLN